MKICTQFMSQNKEERDVLRYLTCGILLYENLEVPPNLILTHSAGLHNRLHIIVPEDRLPVAGSHDDNVRACQVRVTESHSHWPH